MKNPRIALAALGALVVLASPGRAEVAGEVRTFSGPDGIEERCVRLTPFPGAAYSNKDRETEDDYCAIDFARAGLCPKLWSTSPGTLVYALEDDSPAGVQAFERSWCGKGHGARDHAKDKLATFKVSVNGRTTSATYAPSSWVYYHLSRYFRTHTYVPPVVYRSVSLQRHHERVVVPAQALVKGRHARMLSEGWSHLEALESGQLAGGAAREALTDGGRQVYGVLIDNKGDRYGPEFNGTRESGWGSGQNEDFQQTAAFLALRNPSALPDAAAGGVRDARRNPRMAKALPADTPVEQVYLWMQSILEITLLDMLLRQQDRIGNIDYRWRWFWIEDGVLENHSAQGDERPGKAEGKTAWRLRQTAINDNDAGVRSGYANFAERTGMLEELAHYDPALYQRLGRLADDLGERGAAWRWLREVAGLSEREATGIADRARAAFDGLRAQCEAGTLVLDFDLVALLSGTVPQAAGCEVP
ncbi:MAG: hypothetical protein V2I57_00555 [Xanthomonadales bacterium]|jgi:hypothetical protein|nr:hypothetical protein [Xanthomonadales bacterium]